MKKKWIRIILVVFLLVLLVLEGVPLMVNLYLNSNGEKIVSDMITRTNDFGGHEVEFGNIRFDYDYRGTFLQLSDVKIHPGEEVSGKNKIKFNLSFDKASLTGFSWGDFLFRNSIQLDSALIENLAVESISPPIDSLSLKKRSERKGKDYDRIAVNGIRINKASFEDRDSYTDSTRLSIVDLSVFGHDFSLTKGDLSDPDALFHVADAEGYMDHAALHFNEFRNAIHAKDFSFNTTEKKAEIDQIRIENKLKPYEYVNLFAHETDWIELEGGKVGIQGLDLIAYLEQGSLFAEVLNIEEMKLVVFRDKRKLDETQRRPLMIHEIFSELPLPLDIQKVKVVDGYVSYEERPETKAPRSGKVFFDGINATISGLTNKKEKLAENDEMIVDVEGRLLGEGLINLKVTYFLNDSTGRFLMKGSLGSMKLQGLNDIIEPSTKVALKQGKVNSMYFNIAADDNEGTGEVIVKYEDVEIEILDKDFGHDQNIFQKIGSFLANKLVIKSQNPDKKGELKKGAVYYQRDKNKFIFKYWWELVLSGLKSTITGDNEEDLRRKAEKS